MPTTTTSQLQGANAGRKHGSDGDLTVTWPQFFEQIVITNVTASPLFCCLDGSTVTSGEARRLAGRQLRWLVLQPRAASERLTPAARQPRDHDGQRDFGSAGPAVISPQ